MRYDKKTDWENTSKNWVLRKVNDGNDIQNGYFMRRQESKRKYECNRHLILYEHSRLGSNTECQWWRLYIPL